MAQKVGVLTAGGLAPCLSSALGYLLEMYTATDPSIEIICYKSGYKGLLLGDSITVTAEMRAAAPALQEHGGSPIGNSRVKLTNLADCIKRGLCTVRTRHRRFYMPANSRVTLSALECGARCPLPRPAAAA
eukprot:SAG22_NODE_67_length_22882_cov_25.671553_9_plen_131_part_00